MRRAGTNQRVARSASHRQFGSPRASFTIRDQLSGLGSDGSRVRRVLGKFAELRSRTCGEGPRCPDGRSLVWGYGVAPVVASHRGAPCRRPVFPAHQFDAMNNSPLPFVGLRVVRNPAIYFARVGQRCWIGPGYLFRHRRTYLARVIQCLRQSRREMLQRWKQRTRLKYLAQLSTTR